MEILLNYKQFSMDPIMPNEKIKLNPHFWQVPIVELIEQLASTSKGLTSNEAESRLLQFGKNLIHDEKKHSLIYQFLIKFKNPLVIILFIASLLSAFTRDAASFFIISAIVIISVTLDFIQEYRAGLAALSLRDSVSISVQILRDGKIQVMPFADLVPGDVAILSAGDLVPCDGRVIEAKDFYVDQALLTGEPYPVEKSSFELKETTDVLSAGNSVLLGTSVISGSAKVLMCRTGQDTSLGEIADSLLAKAPPTDFEMGIQNFGILIMRMTIFLVLFVILVNTFFHHPWLESFLFAVALAVGLTPELLPMIVSVTLSKGAMRMADKKVIVKRLASIHNLGSMDVFCTDKTGTLTEAKIRLERHLDPQGIESERVIELAYYNSFFETGLKSPLDDAILEHTKFDVSHWLKIDEVPFDFERRRVSVLLENGTERLLVVKGAPEDILRLSKSYESNNGKDQSTIDRDSLILINKQFENLSKEGFRVLGIAYKKVPSDHHNAVVSDEAELTFVGFAGFLDPPKESARNALAGLAADNVEVKIITGDNELVTQHICAQLGFNVTKVLTGPMIQPMDDLSLAAVVEDANLFCRMTPTQKNRIILALKKRGHVVGYLGDGINDAPSLHSADVGISVDSAVNVAKAAADMILLEHDLGVLHDGVLEGRRTFGNIMKYIMMGTSSNFGNMFSMAGASLFLPFLPMLPVQILFNNLLYDFSELPIPLDSVDDSFLNKPHHWDMKFIRNFMLIIGPVSSIFDFLTFYIMLSTFKANEALFHTGWFIESMATQVLVIFIIRTRANPFKSRPNPWLITTSLFVVLLAAIIPLTPVGNHLGFIAPPTYFFLILVIMLIFYLFTVEIIKQWFYRWYNR